MSQFDLPFDHDARMERVALALDGLSIGDAFGEQFFFFGDPQRAVDVRQLPQSPWPYTDDTEMALGIAQVLGERGHVDRDELAKTFARRYALNPGRGYGGMAHHILQNVSIGVPWQHVSPAVFDGQGSMGNGGAMRVAPVGAYFADDFERVKAEAQKSAEVTHAHAEGQAGAIAVAIAGAWAVKWHGQRASPSEMFRLVLEQVPSGETRDGIVHASELDLGQSPQTAAGRLGNGSRVISQDTVPFTLWCAARHLDNYVEAMWTTVSGFGDRDTTCAIVGGIVALSAGRASIPSDWLQAREPLQLRV